MSVFGSMILELSTEAYKDNDFKPITQDEYATFCKEYIFEKLKGIRFGIAFQKRFGVRDRVLSIFSEQIDAMKHIERYYIGEVNV
jgi:hypothetical protein